MISLNVLYYNAIVYLTAGYKFHMLVYIWVLMQFSMKDIINWTYVDIKNLKVH